MARLTMLGLQSHHTQAVIMYLVLVLWRMQVNLMSKLCQQ